MDSLYTKAHIRESLNTRPSSPADDMQWLAGASADLVSQVIKDRSTGVALGAVRCAESATPARGTV